MDHRRDLPDELLKWFRLLLVAQHRRGKGFNRPSSGLIIRSTGHKFLIPPPTLKHRICAYPLANTSASSELDAQPSVTQIPLQGSGVQKTGKDKVRPGSACLIEILYNLCHLPLSSHTVLCAL